MSPINRRRPASQNHARLITAGHLLAEAVLSGQGDSHVARQLANTVRDLVRIILGRDDARADDITAATYGRPGEPPVRVTACCNVAPGRTDGPLWYCPACGYVLNAYGRGRPA